MQDDFDSMVHEMLGYSTSDEIPENEFARLTAIYAYSPFIQFLYSQKLREKDPHRYAASVAKTALYFSNPHWLNHQLRDEHPAELKTRSYRNIEPVVIETGEVDIDEIIDAGEHSEINIANETFDQHPANFVEDRFDEISTHIDEIKEEPVQTINDLYSSDEPSINEEIKSDQISFGETDSAISKDRQDEFPVVENFESGEGELIADSEDVKAEPVETINDLYSSETTTINEEISSENFHVDDTRATDAKEWDKVISVDDAVDVQDVIIPEDQTEISQAYQEEFLPDDVAAAEITPIEDNYERLDAVQEESEQLVYEEKNVSGNEITRIEDEAQDITSNGIQQTNIGQEEESAAVIPDSFENNNVEASNRDEESHVEIVNDIDQVELPNATNTQTDVPAAAPAQLEDIKKSPGPGEFAFEPLYTIDYFASQGIKVNTEDDGKDKLTSRLKSFTDWLKSMKKIHPEKLSREIDDATELNIKTDAEHSNDQSEILTETMAEVFVKQGLNEKALEVYEKLSLLNPSKSDYFAAKISALKAIGI